MSEKIQKKYNEQASSYERMMHWANYAQSMQAFIRSLDLDLTPNAKILDLGCGTGITTVIMREKFPVADLWGLDLSNKMLKICQEKVPSAKLIEGNFNKPDAFQAYTNGEAFAFKSNYFDLIISSGSLSEYGDLGKALPFVKSLLKDDGRLVNIGIRNGIIGSIQSYFWRFKARGIKKFMEASKEAGFNVVTPIKMPLKYFPTNLVKYAVFASL